MASMREVANEVLGKLWIHELRVESATDIADRFRRITLTSPTLRACAPGDKVQLMLSGGTRTYTPFAFDSTRGAMTFAVYVHGTTPGAAWGRDAKAGDTVRCFGPRGSISLAAVQGPIVLVGDETSFGVARSLVDHRGADARASFVFEVTDRAASTAALRALDLRTDDVVERQANDGHVRDLESRVRVALDANTNAHLVLTGRAGAIQSIRAALKSNPTPHASQKNKAYWAPGKRGLD